MAGKRGRLEISADILKVAMDGAKKSHIIYKANLNFKLGTRYLDQLKSYGLIQGPSDRDRAFHTTKKGVEYIMHFDDLKELRGEATTMTRSWEV